MVERLLERNGPGQPAQREAGIEPGSAENALHDLTAALTVAASFAQRAEMFDAEFKSRTPLRRSQLEEFVRASRDAAEQLVGNLHRASVAYRHLADPATSENEGSEADWQEVKTEVLRLLQAKLDTPASHLAFVRERIEPVFDYGPVES
jgi:hypothetical protein